MPRRFAVAPVAIMMLCAFTYKVPGQFNILHRGTFAQAERYQKFQKHDVVAMKAVLTRTVTTAQRMRLRAVVIGPQLMARIRMHAKCTAAQASM